MTNLKDHFGDDASVDPKLATEITAYLTANAGDQGGQRYGAKLLRGVSTTDAPLRITELSKWIDEHRKVPAWEWKHKDVRSKSNCLACHRDPHAALPPGSKITRGAEHCAACHR